MASQQEIGDRLRRLWGGCPMCGSDTWGVTDRPSHLVDDEMLNSLAVGEVVRAQREGRGEDVVGSSLVVWPVLCERCNFVALVKA